MLEESGEGGELSIWRVVVVGFVVSVGGLVGDLVGDLVDACMALAIGSGRLWCTASRRS
jgi:hypothetical protein